MALCTTAFTLCAGTRSRRSPSDEGPAAVLAGSLRPLDGDVLVQAFLADQAGAFVNVTEIALMYSSTWQGWSSLHQQDR